MSHRGPVSKTRSGWRNTVYDKAYSIIRAITVLKIEEIFQVISINVIRWEHSFMTWKNLRVLKLWYCLLITWRILFPRTLTWTSFWFEALHVEFQFQLGFALLLHDWVVRVDLWNCDIVWIGRNQLEHAIAHRWPLPVHVLLQRLHLVLHLPEFPFHVSSHCIEEVEVVPHHGEKSFCQRHFLYKPHKCTSHANYLLKNKGLDMIKLRMYYNCLFIIIVYS